MGGDDPANCNEKSTSDLQKGVREHSMASARTSTGSSRLFYEERERRNKNLEINLQIGQNLAAKIAKRLKDVEKLSKYEARIEKIRREKSFAVRKIEKIVSKVNLQGSSIVIPFEALGKLGEFDRIVPLRQICEITKRKLEKDLRSADKQKRFAINVHRAARSQRLERTCSLLLQRGRHSVISPVFDRFKLYRNSPQLPVVPYPIQGLPNVGNTCYMNSALNALFHLPQLKQFMQNTGNHPNTDLALAFQRFCTDYQSGNDMRSRVYEIQRSLPEFADGRQHCSHSFILKFLAKLDKDIPCDCGLGPEFLQSSFAQRFTNYQKAKCKELHSIFSALTENVFTCSNCFFSWVNMSYSRTLDLPITSTFTRTNDATYFSQTDFYCESVAQYYRLPTGRSNYTTAFRLWKPAQFLHIPTLDSSNLEDCFEFMLRASLMTPSNTIDCEGCGQATQHYKQSFLRHLSPVLMLHFQRYNEATGEKLETRIRCPERLDMGKYVPGAGKYRLTSIINHYGSLSWGHYTAYIRVGERWYHFNDSMLEEIRYSTELDRSAYVVTYIKQQNSS
jgi:ubiquitin C-terminal hydrolase